MRLVHKLPSWKLAAACLVFSPCFSSPAQENTQVAPLVLHVESREVVIDVVVRDHRNNSVNDMNPNEFEVYEQGKHGDKEEKHVLGVHKIDPQRDASHAGSIANGFHISSGAVCALNATVHYEIAIPASSEPGYHQILVKTTRPGVTLSFRRRYYVGQKPETARLQDKNSTADEIALSEAACFHPVTPPTLAVAAVAVAVPAANATRYAAVVRPESLAAIGLDETNSHVQLDFGICTFDATGSVLQYFHSTIDRTLEAADMEKTLKRGYFSVLEIPGPEPPPLARLVLVDRRTGNLGMVDVAKPISKDAQADPAKALPRKTGSVRSFGVVTPRENTFCGDVYELSTGTGVLPEFWNLDPVGSLYTDALNVPQQDINQAEGIPGVTRTNTWFGVDYYGEFYISKPGEYKFDLESDDGSMLYIDDQKVIDLDGTHLAMGKTVHIQLTEGWHTVHVPYFQGPPTELALVLQIQPPGESMRVFKLSEFLPPKTTAPQK